MVYLEKERGMTMGRIKKSALLLCMGILAVLGSIAAGAKQAEAYTLETDFNGIYGKEMPSYILKNVEPLFRKHVDKAVKKYNKYAQLREDDYVSYTKKVSKEDNKLGELMKKVKDDDVLRICRPFYIYNIWYSQKGVSEYYFLVTRNGKDFCKFRLQLDDYSGKIYFSYDESDHFLQINSKTPADMIFYRNREYVYGETAEGKETLRDSRNTGEWLATDDDMAAQDRDQSFKKLSYDQKKKVIMENLAVMKKGKIKKKAIKYIKKDLGKEYVESESDKKIVDSPLTAFTEKKDYKKYIVGGVVVVAVLLAAFILRKLYLKFMEEE